MSFTIDYNAHMMTGRVLDDCFWPRRGLTLALSSKTTGFGLGLDGLASASTPVTHLLVLVLTELFLNNFYDSITVWISITTQKLQESMSVCENLAKKETTVALTLCSCGYCLWL